VCVCACLRLGLYHPFAGAVCDPNPAGGDFVDDTPAMSVQYGCPVGMDSCPTVPGLDPIHNIMGYSDDDCMDGFTPNQVTRCVVVRGAETWDLDA
jgi:hypothetical protein